MFIRPASTGESQEEAQPMVQDNENQVDPDGLKADDWILKGGSKDTHNPMNLSIVIIGSP